MVILRKWMPLSLVIIFFIITGCAAFKQAQYEQAALKQAANEEISGAVMADPVLEPVIKDGFVRLVLHERNGSFSLSYVPNVFSSLYEPLFISRNPRSSYVSVSVNDKIYRLGRSRAFKTSIIRLDGDPAFVFESDFLRVTKAFTPVRTSGSANANGIKVTITVYNTSEEEIEFALRFLLDTALGEEMGRFPFVTEKQIITGEMIIKGSSGERYWLSSGESVSLMGSIVNPVDSNSIIPDYIHFANWKRLNDVPWNLRYAEGRSFSNFPYSINDSAVCYYYEPVHLGMGGYLAYTIFLTTEDIDWYRLQEDDIINMYIVRNIQERTVDLVAMDEHAALEARQNNPNVERATLPLLRQILVQFVAGDIYLNELALEEIERIVQWHLQRAQNGQSF